MGWAALDMCGRAMVQEVADEGEFTDLDLSCEVIEPHAALDKDPLGYAKLQTFHTFLPLRCR